MRKLLLAAVCCGLVAALLGLDRAGVQAAPAEQAGFIYPFAGGGMQALVDGVDVLAAGTAQPLGVAVNPVDGTVAFTEYGFHPGRVWKVVNGRAVAVVGPGNGGKPWVEGGLAKDAPLGTVQGLAADVAGNLYVASPSLRKVLKVDRAGRIWTVAGNGASGSGGDGGDARSAELTKPVSVAASPGGERLYISDQDADRVRVVDLGTMRISSFAQNYAFDGPMYLAVGPNGDVVVPSWGKDEYARFHSNGAFLGLLRFGNGAISAAYDAAGRILLTDFLHGTLWACTIPNNAPVCDAIVQGQPLGVAGSSKGDGGPGSQAQIWRPHQIATDLHHVYLSEALYSSRIRKVVLNRPPAARFTMTGCGFPAPDRVRVDGRASTDPDGDPLTYDWELAPATTRQGAVVDHTYKQAGLYLVTLVVTDAYGDSDSATDLCWVKEGDPSSLGVQVPLPTPNFPVYPHDDGPEPGPLPFLRGWQVGPRTIQWVLGTGVLPEENPGGPLRVTWRFGDQAEFVDGLWATQEVASTGAGPVAVEVQDTAGNSVVFEARDVALGEWHWDAQ